LKIIRLFGTVFLLAAVVGFFAAMPLFAQTPPLSGADILAKSQAAYDALTSYSCHVVASGTGVGTQTFSATADIAFVRPGELSATGTTMANTPYAFVTNGASSSITANGTTAPAQSVEAGLASVTGIGLQAPTLVSALLLHTKWAAMYAPGQTVSNTITTQLINGRPCYEVDVLYPIKRAFWVDMQTFLLAQVATRITVGQLGTLHFLQTITNSQINPTIPSSAFNVPGG
jgi:outer membrane lipoprotein-sorting protein